MSRAAKFTLAVSLAFTGCTIYAVHLMQTREKEIMQLGIRRDQERRERRRLTAGMENSPAMEQDPPPPPGTHQTTTNVRLEA